MTHSPEPWSLKATPSILKEVSPFGAMLGNDPCGFSGELNHIGNTIKKEDAERIVACVNACAGIPTEDLVNMTENRTNERRILELFRLWTPRLEQAFAIKKKYLGGASE